MSDRRKVVAEALPRSPKDAYRRGRDDERDRCIKIIKKWFGGEDIFDRGYECVREITLHV